MVCNEEHDVLWGMPRRVNRFELDVPDVECIAVFEQGVLVRPASGFLIEPLVFPVRAAFIGDINMGTVSLREFA